MPEIHNFFCHFCQEEIAWSRENPLFAHIIVGQPGDRQGSSVDLTQVPPLMAAIFQCPISRIDMCEQCFDKVFKVDMEMLKSYFDWKDVSLEHPGYSVTEVEIVKSLHPRDPRRRDPRLQPLIEKIHPNDPPVTLADITPAQPPFRRGT